MDQVEYCLSAATGERQPGLLLSGNALPSVHLNAFDGECSDQSSHHSPLTLLLVLAESHDKTNKVLQSEPRFLVYDKEMVVNCRQHQVSPAHHVHAKEALLKIFFSFSN